MKSESARGYTDFAPELSRGEVGCTYDGTPTRSRSCRAPCGGCLKDVSADFNQEDSWNHGAGANYETVCYPEELLGRRHIRQQLESGRPVTLFGNYSDNMSVLLEATGHQMMHFKRQIRLQLGILFEEKDILTLFEWLSVCTLPARRLMISILTCEFRKRIDHGDETDCWMMCSGHLLWFESEPRSDYTEC